MNRFFTLKTFFLFTAFVFGIKYSAAQVTHYTVNRNAPVSATNYTSFSSLITDLTTNGVTTPVVVDVEPGSGTYNERLVFTHINGTSATNTIRINGNGVQVEYNTSASERQMLVFDNVQYVTVDSLKFKANGTQYGWASLFTKGADHDSVTRCEFDMSRPDNGNPIECVQGFVFSDSYTDPDAPTGRNSTNCYVGHNHVIGNNGFRGMTSALRVHGRNDNLIFAYNTAENFHITGLVIADSAIGVQVLYNDVFRDHQNDAAEYTGIAIAGYVPGLRVVGNRFHHPTNLVRPREFRAIQLMGSSATAADPALVANNAIYDIRGMEGRSGTVGGIITGIYISGVNYCKIYHNTIDIGVQLTGSEPHYGIYVIGTNTGLEIKNNNISITEGSSGPKYGFYYDNQNSVTGADVQMNNFYVNSAQSGNQYYGHYANADYNTHALFIAANPAFEQASPTADPQYVNAAIGDLHVQNTPLIGVGLNLLADVPLDIERVARASAPTLGAFETAVPIDAGAREFVAPSGQYCADSQEVSMSVYNAGTTNIDSLQVYWSVNGVLQPTVFYRQTLVPQGTPGRNMDTIVLGKVYIPNNTATVIKAWTSLPNGQPDMANGNDTLTQKFQATHYYVTADDDSVCIGEDARMTLHPSSGYNPGDLIWQHSGNGYNWSNILNTDNVDYTENDLQSDTWFRVRIGGVNGCYSDSIKITALPLPVVDLGRDTSVCNIVNLTLQSRRNYNNTATYRWSTNEFTPSIKVGQTGLYALTVTENGCVGSDSILVTFDTLLVDLGNDTVLCEGQSIILNSSIPYSLHPTFRWNTGATTSSIRVNESGLYLLSVTDEGCTGSDSVRITVPHLTQNLGGDTLLCEETPINLTLQGNVPEGSYALWSTGENTPDIYVNEAGTYWITVTQAPCFGSDTMTVRTRRCDCRVFIPNAFSPNGDGLNDEFIPKFDPGCPVQAYNFQVYNRYGQLVYRSNKEGEGWDGTYGNGKPADVGTYMCILTYHTLLSSEVKVQRGSITLIR